MTFALATDARKARGEATKKIMDEKGVSAAQLAAKVYPEDLVEREKLTVKLHNVRSKTANMTTNLAKLLAPHLGVVEMDLLVDHTERELGTGNKKSAAPTPVDPTTEKAHRKEALEKFMGERNISAQQIVEKLREVKLLPEDADVQFEALKIAEARSGGELLAFRDCCNIATAYEVEVKTLLSGLTEEELGQATDTEKEVIYPQSKRKSVPRKKVATKKNKAAKKMTTKKKKKGAAPKVTGVPRSIEVTPDELVELVGNQVQIEEEDGKYYVLAKQQITQKDLLKFLLEKLS